MALQCDVCLLGKSMIASYDACLVYFVEAGFKSATLLEMSRAPRDARLVAMRHDVDHNLVNARLVAEIERRREVRASYYFLPPGDYGVDSNYYGVIEDGRIVHHEAFSRVVCEIAEMGHEIGIHHDFVQLSERTGRPVEELFAAELAHFKSIGIEVLGACSHGSRYARRHAFTNYHVFAAETHPQPGRVVEDGDWSFELGSVDMTSLGLEYEAYWVPCDLYVSDVGSAVSVTDKRNGCFVRVDDGGLAEPAALLDAEQLATSSRVIVLTHPEWWRLTPDSVAAMGFSVSGPTRSVPENRVRLGIDDVGCTASCQAVVESAPTALGRYLNFEGDEDPASRHAAAIRVAEDAAAPSAHPAAAGTTAGLFAPKLFAPDLAAIAAAGNARRSKPSSDRDIKSTADFGGTPTGPIGFAWPRCSQHWSVVRGLFRERAGRRQGAIQVDRRLHAYLSVRRYRDLVSLGGLGNFLESPDEMDDLLADTVRWLGACDTPHTAGIRYIVCGAWPASAALAARLSDTSGFRSQTLYADCSPHTLTRLLDEPYA